MQALKKRRSPGAERAVTRALERKAKANALAAAPVEKSPTYPALSLQWGSYHPIRSTEWVDVVAPDETYETNQRQASIADEPEEGKIRGNSGNDRAALRAHLMGAEAYGPVLQLAMLVQSGPITARTVVVEGRLSAIRAMFPDQMSLKAWREAGATELPTPNLEVMYLYAPTSSEARVRFLQGAVKRIPVDQAPRVVQMETLGRSIRGGMGIRMDEFDEERRRDLEAALKKDRKTPGHEQA